MNNKKAKYLRKLSKSIDPSKTVYIKRGGQLINLHNKYTLFSSIFYRLANSVGRKVYKRHSKAKKFKKIYKFVIALMQKIKNKLIPTALVGYQTFCLGNRSTYKAIKKIYKRDKITTKKLLEKELLKDEEQQ